MLQIYVTSLSYAFGTIACGCLLSSVKFYLPNEQMLVKNICLICLHRDYKMIWMVKGWWIEKRMSSYKMDCKRNLFCNEWPNQIRFTTQNYDGQSRLKRKNRVQHPSLTTLKPIQWQLLHALTKLNPRFNDNIKYDKLW